MKTTQTKIEPPKHPGAAAAVLRLFAWAAPGVASALLLAFWTVHVLSDFAITFSLNEDLSVVGYLVGLPVLYELVRTDRPLEALAMAVSIALVVGLAAYGVPALLDAVMGGPPISSATTKP